RVVQLVEHAVDRHLIELPLVERVDVVVGDVRQHVLEQARLLVHGSLRHGLALQQPATGRERDARDDGDDQDLSELHDTPRVESTVTAMTSRHAASCTAFFDCVASMWATPGPAAPRYAASAGRITLCTRSARAARKRNNSAAGAIS